LITIVKSKTKISVRNQERTEAENYFSNYEVREKFDAAKSEKLRPMVRRMGLVAGDKGAVRHWSCGGRDNKQQRLQGEQKPPTLGAQDGRHDN
jgi:hypothetical protein